MNNSSNITGSDDNTREGTAEFGFTFTMGLLLIVLNTVSIYLLATSKSIAPQIKTLVLNLSLADLQVGMVVVCIPFTSGVILSKWVPNVGKLTSVLSQFFTMTISVDRMLSVAHPNLYLFHATEERTAKIGRIIWITFYLFFLIMIILIALNSTFIDLAMDIFTVSLYLVVLFCFLYSTFVLYRHGKRVMKSLNINGFSGSKSFILQNYKPTIILLTLCITFIVLTFPMFFAISMRVTVPRFYKGLSGILDITRRLAALNHFVNPFLYIFRFKECRERLLRVLCRKKMSRVGNLSIP